MNAKRLLVATLVFLGLGGSAQAQPGVRSEVPIREVVLDNGLPLYSVSIKLGGTTIEAGLDTGSSGLRILPGTLAAADAQRGGASDDYSFGSGVVYGGEVAKGTLSVGALAAPIAFQAVNLLTCSSDKRDCPALGLKPEDIGMRGNSLTGGRFHAILGVNMADAEVPSPLKAIGAARWIVELPHRGDTAPGKLILNPGDDEIKDFVRLAILDNFSMAKGGLHDAVSGCLLNTGKAIHICGPLLMDSGAPGIRVENARLDRGDWADGTAAALGFYDGKSLRAAESLVIGQPDQASQLHGGPMAKIVRPLILAGNTAYLAFDVLYDPGKSEVGLRPRPPVTGGPLGQLVSGPAQ